MNFKQISYLVCKIAIAVPKPTIQINFKKHRKSAIGKLKIANPYIPL